MEFWRESPDACIIFFVFSENVCSFHVFLIMDVRALNSCRFGCMVFHTLELRTSAAHFASCSIRVIARLPTHCCRMNAVLALRRLLVISRERVRLLASGTFHCHVFTVRRVMSK
uniref:Uncharacterized protein n=1 Tax=Rhipicephalus microplus TaxID=6941 RepID=A0A6G5AFY8_RHIMP